MQLLAIVSTESAKPSNKISISQNKNQMLISEKSGLLRSCYSISLNIIDLCLFHFYYMHQHGCKHFDDL